MNRLRNIYIDDVMVNKMDKVISQNPEIYESRSQYIRIAIMKQLRKDGID